MYNSLRYGRTCLCRIIEKRGIRTFTTNNESNVVESRSTLNNYGLPESKEFFVPGISNDPFYKDINLPKRCIGCGAPFQILDENKPGYVDQEVLNQSGARGSSRFPRIRGIEIENAPEGVDVDKSEPGKFSIKKRRVICRRCYKLQYYKRVDLRSEVDSQREVLVKELLESDEFKRSSIRRVLAGTHNTKKFPVLMTKLESETKMVENSIQVSSTPEIISQMATRIKNDSLVLFVVDLTNVEISVIPELYIALRNRALDIIWVANKLDVLPKVAEESEIKTWLRSVVRHIGNSKSSDVILVSSSKGTGFDQLEKRFKEHLKPGEPRNIYVVGATNVGKSTFVDRFLEFIRYKHVGTLNMKRSVGGVTRSAIPGTTLEFIEFGLPNGFKLVDTPGIPIISQLPSLLYKPVDLISISLNKTINPLYIKVDEGQSLLIGGVARVDLVQGTGCVVQCFFGNGVTMKVCRTVASDDIMSHQVGNKLYPPHSKEDYKKMLPFSKYRVMVNCNGPRPLDEFVICGLGWFSFSGTGPKVVEMRPAMITSPPRGVDKNNILNQRGRIKSIMKLRKCMLDQIETPSVESETNISKPFANYLKRRAAHNERFRNICIYFGNKSFAFERSISRRFYNSELGEVDKVTLSPEKSVNIGSELLGECFIFSVAAGLITAEYVRGALKESRKEFRLKQRLDTIDSKQEELQKLIKEEVSKQLANKFPVVAKDTGKKI